MVVKSATKKKLMDMLVPEEFAHKLAVRAASLDRLNFGAPDPLG